jgi:hypothetical protein
MKCACLEFGHFVGQAIDFRGLSATPFTASRLKLWGRLATCGPIGNRQRSEAAFLPRMKCACPYGVEKSNGAARTSAAQECVRRNVGTPDAQNARVWLNVSAATVGSLYNRSRKLKTHENNFVEPDSGRFPDRRLRRRSLMFKRPGASSSTCAKERRGHAGTGRIGR